MRQTSTNALPELDSQTFATALEWLAQDRQFAIALVIDSWGSSPRQSGSAMLISDDGKIAGSVSGGCVESEVIDAAQGALTTLQPATLTFGVSDERAWSQGLSCGGTISVAIYPLHDDFITPTNLHQIDASLSSGQSTYFAINKSSGRAKLTTDIAADNDYLFAIKPPRQLVIIGAGHIAQYLCPLANMAGFGVTIIDPRAPFVTTERFPDATLHEGWPSRILTAASLTSQTAFVTLTHKPEIDDDGLTIALASEAFHICALGSKKTHAARLDRLSTKQEPAALARIKGPAGLPIGAKSPAEIALSIMAEIIAAYHGQLRDPAS